MRSRGLAHIIRWAFFIYKHNVMDNTQKGTALRAEYILNKLIPTRYGVITRREWIERLHIRGYIGVVEHERDYRTEDYTEGEIYISIYKAAIPHDRSEPPFYRLCKTEYNYLLSLRD